MYQNHPPPPVAPMDPLSMDPTPDADAGKSSMYKANPGLPYSGGGGSDRSPSRGVNNGTTGGRTSSDPNFPMRR
jgi:hypothetical protein